MNLNRLTAIRKGLIDLDATTGAQIAERRWGAVLTADVVEYSRLTGIDQEQTYFLYQSHRREVLYPKTRQYGARFLKSTGDGIMAEFRSAIDAARCAIDVQRSMDERSRAVAKDRRIIFRIGLSCGRIIADPDDIYGHDVNVSARLQTVAPPGGIAMSGEVAALVRQTLPFSLEDMGEHHFHNMNCTVRVFQCRVATMVNRKSINKGNGIKAFSGLDARLTLP